MAPIEKIPNEVAIAIAECLDTRALLDLCVVNRWCSSIATAVLFRTDVLHTPKPRSLQFGLRNRVFNIVVNAIQAGARLDELITTTKPIPMLHHQASTVNNTSFMKVVDPDHSFLLTILRGLRNDTEPWCRFTPIDRWEEWPENQKAIAKMEEWDTNIFQDVHAYTYVSKFRETYAPTASFDRLTDTGSQRSLPSYLPLTGYQNRLCPLVMTVGTHLHNAAAWGFDEILLELIFAGADLEIGSDFHCGCAAMRFWTGMTKDALIARIYPPRGYEDTQVPPSRVAAPAWTPLHLAICHRNPETAKLLLTLDASPMVGSRDAYLVTALHTAAGTGQNDLVEFILQMHHDRDIDERDCNGFTALHYAVINGYWDTTGILLRDRGADIDAPVLWYKSKSDIRSESLLVHYLHDGLFEKALQLLRLGANPRAIAKLARGFRGLAASFTVEAIGEHLFSEYDFVSLLSLCCLPNPSHRLPTLTAELFPVEETVKRDFGHPDYWMAGTDRDEEFRVQAMACLLIEDMPSWIAANTDICPPLLLAAAFHVSPALELLLRRGFEVDVMDKRGNTALMLACEHIDAPWGRQLKLRNLRVLNLLLRYGANVNAVNKSGKTALQILCSYPDRYLFRQNALALLLAAGADPNYSSTAADGNSFAAESDFRKGAGVPSTQSAFQTILQEEPGNFEAAELLFSHGGRASDSDILRLFKQEARPSHRSEKDSEKFLNFLLEIDVNKALTRDWNTAEHLLKDPLTRAWVPENFMHFFSRDILRAHATDLLRFGCQKLRYPLIQAAIFDGAIVDRPYPRQEGFSRASRAYEWIDDYSMGVVGPMMNQTPLLVVTLLAGPDKILELLLDAGADIHFRPNWGYWTSPLEAAILARNQGHVRLMLSKSPPLNVNPLTPRAVYLHTAVDSSEGKPEIKIITMLRLAGADPCEADGDGMTPLAAFLHGLIQNRPLPQWLAAVYSGHSLLMHLIHLLWHEQMNGEHHCPSIARDLGKLRGRGFLGVKEANEEMGAALDAIRDQTDTCWSNGKQHVRILADLPTVEAIHGGTFGLDEQSSASVAGTVYRLD